MDLRRKTRREIKRPFSATRQLVTNSTPSKNTAVTGHPNASVHSSNWPLLPSAIIIALAVVTAPIIAVVVAPTPVGPIVAAAVVVPAIAGRVRIGTVTARIRVVADIG